MPSIDLKTDDGLKAACAEVRTRIDPDQVREVAALIQEIRDAPQSLRADLAFQVRVWSDLSLWRGGLMMRRRLDPTTFLEEDGLHKWFAEKTTQSLPKNADRRVETLTELYNTLIEKVEGGEYGGQPRVETLRTLALFFPRDFTALADPAKIVPLARSMGLSVSDADFIRANRLVLDRLRKVVGRPADGLEGTVERMLLPCELYRLENPSGRLWVVRAGKDGEDEEYVLKNGMAMLGFHDLPPPHARTYDEYLNSVTRDRDSGHSARSDSSATRQVWNFAWELQKSDIVVLPGKKSGPVAWGTVEGAYRQRQVEREPRHTRRVKWERTDIPRSAFGDDEKYLNQPRTVFSLDNQAQRLIPILGVPARGGTALRPLPAAQRCRTLPTGFGQQGFEALKAILSQIGSGTPHEDLVRQLQDAHQWKRKRSSWYLSAIRAAFGVSEHHDGAVRPTEIGRDLQQTGNSDALRDRLLTRNLGFDHLLVWLDSAARGRKWLQRELREVHAGWTTTTFPNGLLLWLQLLDLANEDAKSVFHLTERGKEWRSRIHWEPEHLETSSPSDFDAVWTTLSEITEKSNLRFDRPLVEALHLGLWAGPRRHFAVLSGLSGTGKTQIALRYAMALTGAERDTGGPVEVVPVHPGWYDPGPLLGYVNPLTPGSYRSTQFLNLLLRASKNIGQPHVVILDEMNLSHPEQYFAPILSAMERQSGEIPLHQAEEDELGIPPGVAYPPNLVIIGTVNMDETTMGISDKVLDRAFTLEFWDIDPDRWPGWDGCKLSDAEKAKVRGVLNELTEALSPARRHFGWRVIKEVVGFLEGRSQDSGIELTAADALDRVIYAKVLPKLRGSDTGRFRKCLDATLSVLEEHGLKRCAQKVKALKEDLESTGSCSFWR